jgi:hypothetical protein
MVVNEVEQEKIGVREQLRKKGVNWSKGIKWE